MLFVTACVGVIGLPLQSNSMPVGRLGWRIRVPESRPGFPQPRRIQPRCTTFGWTGVTSGSCWPPATTCITSWIQEELARQRAPAGIAGSITAARLFCAETPERNTRKTILSGLSRRLSALRVLSYPGSSVIAPPDTGIGDRGPGHADDVDKHRHVRPLGRHLALQHLARVSEIVCCKGRIPQHGDNLPELESR